MPSERNDAPPRTDRCRECNSAVAPDANFCPGCGADLRAADSRDDAPSAYCTECGESVAPDDEFCANCGAPCESTEVGDAVDPDARREFRVRVRDHLNAGWELTEDHGDRVVLVHRDIGSIPVHVLLLPTTGGVGNLLYGWYNYSEMAETRRLSVSDGPIPDGELTTRGDDDDPLVTLSGYLLGGILLLIGLGIAAVSAEVGSVPVALFGLAFAAIGLGISPPGERRLDRRHGITRFGRIRTIDHRITPATERTEAPVSSAARGSSAASSAGARRDGRRGRPGPNPLDPPQPLLRRLRPRGAVRGRRERTEDRSGPRSKRRRCRRLRVRTGRGAGTRAGERTLSYRVPTRVLR
ncbi:zinc ribbon domain-containing protein [Halorubrum saccharovorum]|uniref:zinc ribbon domain-containing protein n=1 Tax=Halorubrum saccharovorum TaxID=2248 RepID=UPI001F2F9443|nr:zinc ribbon domain-containing protein [Halorubrum saccharovorum]